MTTARLVLASVGRASDAAFLAAADVAAIAEQLGVEYRLVGGNAVSLLVALHGVGDLVPARETADADFGADYAVIADERLLPALQQRGYAQEQGNRFTRRHTLPSLQEGVDDLSWDLVVDVLAPSYGSRLTPNQVHGDLVVDAVPGLSLALSRAGIPVTVDVHLTSGHALVAELMLPDVTAALCLKAYGYAGRFADRDAVDLWRLLEAAYAAGVTSATWPTTASATDAAAVLRRFFARPAAPGLVRASRRPADQTRIRALVAHVVGSG